jgi:hypothetical protein
MTIAVHGDIPSRMIPAMNSGCPGKIVFAKRVARGGFMIQFATMVRSNGLGLLVAFTMSLNLI